MAGGGGRARASGLTPVVRGLLLLAAAALVFHAAAWIEAAVIIARGLKPPPLQSAVVLALSAMLLRVTDVTSRRWRIRATSATLILFAIAMVAMPLDHQFEGNGFMGDGYDYSQDRDKFERNIPMAGAHQELHFKSHLGDLTMALIDRAAGRTETSPATAYATLSRIGGVLFLGELALVLVLFRASRRACRFVALAMAAPLALTFFAYYEVGYLSVGIAVFPLILYAVHRRGDGMAVDAAGGLQGLHAAFHGFGLVGIAGGTLAALAARRRGLSLAFRFAAFGLAFYLGWVVIYIVGMGMSIVSDPYASHIAFRKLFQLYVFDKRLVHPLLSWNGIGEVGMASLGIGVPLLVLGIAKTRASLERQAALLFALPALLFLIVWWPSAGVEHDMDLLLGAFGAISAGAWLAARTPRAAFQGWILLAATHLLFWAVVANRTMDRVWLTR
ncbi:MAG: hypothetical protein DMF88_15220 [Acidobacteria bacterium]|nr:MAG: hypothetical protein DMF88_15220 [Acidobacteriota bacterium]